MRKYLSVTLALAFIYICIPVIGTNQSRKIIASASETRVAYEPDSVKVRSKASINEDFADDTVIIGLTKRATFEFKDYAIKDFPEVTLALVEDLTQYTNDMMQRAASTGFDKETGKELKIEKYRKILRLTLEEVGKENVLYAVSILEKRNDVQYAKPDYFGGIDAVTPNDPHFIHQWAVDPIKLPQAWDITTGLPTVRVGVLDTGIDSGHPDLSANMVPGAIHGDFTKTPAPLTSAPVDNYGHGTHVAGIIGATGNNNIGIAGTAWNVKMVSLKVATDTGTIKASYLTHAILYAELVNIPILNFSGWTQEDRDLKDAISAYSGLFVTSAGNYNRNIDTTPQFPASFGLPNMLVVGASVAKTDIRCSYSNWGPNMVDLFAPGDATLSTFSRNRCDAGSFPIVGGRRCEKELGDWAWEETVSIHHATGYHFMPGTSMAAPFVTGVAALIKSKYPTFSYGQIKAAIINSVDPVSALQGRCVSGGRLNAYEALKVAARNGTWETVWTGNVTVVSSAASPVSSGSIDLMTLSNQPLKGHGVRITYGGSKAGTCFVLTVPFQTNITGISGFWPIAITVTITKDYVLKCSAGPFNSFSITKIEITKPLTQIGQIRYIRDWVNGSTSNTSNHWIQIQALNSSGNMALGKTVTSNQAPLVGVERKGLQGITDGNVDTIPYADFAAGLTWVQVDLGAVFNIKQIKIHHYYGDGRTYNQTKTEVSLDGIDWFTLFDSAIQGTYVETSGGNAYIYRIPL